MPKPQDQSVPTLWHPTSAPRTFLHAQVHFVRGLSPYRHWIVQRTKPSPATQADKATTNTATRTGRTRGRFSPVVARGPPSPANRSKPWTGPPYQDWGPPRSSKQASSLSATSTLQDALTKSRGEATTANAEAQAARAEAAALREHIAKLEAQISALVTSHAIQPTPVPTASPPPFPQPTHRFYPPWHTQPRQPNFLS
ncbi:hypothetical protein MTO96_044970 [Rhipicephalus appendiculatus]